MRWAKKVENNRLKALWDKEFDKACRESKVKNDG